MNKSKLVALLAVFIASLLINGAFSQEYIVFNKIKSTTSITNNQLNNITTVSGSGFKFTSQNSTFALSKTGNNVNGTLSFVNANGSKTSYAGSIEGKFTASSNTIGLYFLSGTTYFVLIVPSFENHNDFDDNDDPNFNSSGPYDEIESLKQTQQANNNVVATMSDASASESGSGSYITFTLTFTQNRSLNNTITFSPTVTNSTASRGNDFSTTISYSTDNSNWTDITSTASIPYNKNTVYIRCSIVDDTDPECAETFSISTGTFTHSGTSEVDNYSGVYGIGTINDNNDPLIWNGSSSDNWDLAANWTPNLSPNTCFTIQIPGSLQRYPAYTSNSSNSRVSGINILSGGNLNISSGTLAVTGSVTNNDNTNGIYGSGVLELNGTSAQSISGTGLFQNVKINNSAGVTISSGEMIVKGTLTPTSGLITTNNRLTFRNNATDHGEIGTISGCPRQVFSGNVTTEKYIPANKRSYRFLTPGVTTSTSIKTNWQENTNVTSASSYPNTAGSQYNPNGGYGTHITGNSSGQNGFDATLTGNPSLFTFNQGNQVWQAINNTNTLTLSTGEAYRVLVRGSRATDLTSNSPTPDNTTIRTTGTLTTCEYSFTSQSTIPLSSTVGKYTFIGNPYWSVVDWNNLTISGIEDNIYYWDPTLAGTNNRGAYVSVNRTTGNSNSSSRVDRYIQPGQAFFVKTTNSTPSITFNENQKNNGNKKDIFERNQGFDLPIENAESIAETTTSKEIDKIYLSLSIKNSLGNVISDGCLLSYREDFSNDYSKEDASKLENLDENISMVSNGLNYAILGRKKLVNLQSDTIKLALWNLYEKPYVLAIDPRSFDKSKNIYFVNKKQNTYNLIDSSKIFEYEFQPMAGQKTNNDFYILINGSRIASSNPEQLNKLVIFPNPTTEELYFTIPKDETIMSVSIIDAKGKKTVTKSNSASNNKIITSSLKTGNYWIEVKTQKTTRVANFLKY